MTLIRLNTCAKELDSKVNYINPKSTFTINPNTTRSETKDMTFLAESLTKEVIPKKEKKKFVKVALRTITMSVSTLSIVDPTFALAATVTPAIPVNATVDPITTQDIIQLCKWILGIVLVLSFAIAMVMSVIAGSLGYFRKSDQSFKWIIEIIKSFVMVMLTPTIILTIAVVAYMLFGGSDWFIKPF